MPTLHIVNRSPYESPVLATCVRLLSPGDALLLTENGVYAALAGTGGAEVLAAVSEATVFVLGPHLDARGLSNEPLVTGVAVADFERFVDLTVAYDVSVSWS